MPGCYSSPLSGLGGRGERLNDRPRFRSSWLNAPMQDDQIYVSIINEGAGKFNPDSPYNLIRDFPDEKAKSRGKQWARSPKRVYFGPLLIKSGCGNRIAYTPDGRLIAIANQDYIRLVDSQNGHLLATLTGQRGAISSMAFSPNGKYPVSGAKDGTIRIWGVNQ
jgi:WD40 repeat protein